GPAAPPPGRRMGRARGSRPAIRSRGRRRSSWRSPLDLLEDPADPLGARPLGMTVGSRQLPPPERPPGDGQEVEDPPHPPGLKRQPPLIEPSARLDRGGEAVVEIGRA